MLAALPLPAAGSSPRARRARWRLRSAFNLAAEEDPAWTSLHLMPPRENGAGATPQHPPPTTIASIQRQQIRHGIHHPTRSPSTTCTSSYFPEYYLYLKLLEWLPAQDANYQNVVSNIISSPQGATPWPSSAQMLHYDTDRSWIPWAHSRNRTTSLQRTTNNLDGIVRRAANQPKVGRQVRPR